MPGSAKAPQVLIVDDDEGLLILMAEALRAEGYGVTTADSGRGALDWLEQHRPDLMILDLKLQDVDATSLVKTLRSAATPVPFVVVTGQGDEKIAVDVMKHGALDYVMKDTGLLDLLPSVVKRALDAIARDTALATARDEQRRLENEIIETGERERHSIGADLHDGLGQQLTAIELMCAIAKVDAAPYPALAQQLDQIGRRLREAIAQTRFLARGLVPVGSEPDALQIGLTELAGRMNGLGQAACVFESPEPVAVADAKVAAHLYRIAQEAVNNALKHARAKHIRLRLEEDADGLLLEIADDGAGLPKREVREGVGLGVMRHRASLIGAELTIGSTRGGGVTIRCRLPRKK